MQGAHVHVVQHLGTVPQQDLLVHMPTFAEFLVSNVLGALAEVKPAQVWALMSRVLKPTTLKSVVYRLCGNLAFLVAHNSWKAQRYLRKPWNGVLLQAR